MAAQDGLDEAIAVDWSGSTHTSGHIALAIARDGRLRHLEPPESREEAVDRIIECAGHAEGRLAVGLDFSFSLPAWFLRSRGLASARQLWQLVATEGEEWLAACEPPFWGRPGRTRPDLETHERRTELECAPVAGVRPKSTFQIGGGGSVGTGSLRGMPFLLRLSEAGFAIWPFDAVSERTVFEIYPRLCTGPVTKSSPAARRACLGPWMACGAVEAAEATIAMWSEDAFDAALSAVVLSRRQGELWALTPARDDFDRLEGRIAPVTWSPPGR